MTSSTRPMLQLAIDALDTKTALTLAEKAHPFFDIAEIGTPLIIEEGLHALTAVKERFPDKQCLADVKIMDAGRIEAESAFRQGADIVSVLAVADDRTIAGALEVAEKYNGLIMADLINTPDPLERAEELEKLGVHVVCLHLGFDVQGFGDSPIERLKLVRNAVRTRSRASETF